jgi:hypothetical protein
MAKKKREETGDAGFCAPMEKIKLTALQRAENVLARPFKILFLEVRPPHSKAWSV